MRIFGSLEGLILWLKMGVGLGGGILGTLIFELKSRVGWKKKTKN